jgi:hypothetical protein
MYVGHALDPLSAAEVTTLQVDAYATTSPLTINSGVGLGREPAPNGANYGNSFSVAWQINAQTGGWFFDTRGIGGTTEEIAGGIDEEVTLQIVIDGPSGTVYGVLESPSTGRHHTEAQAIDAATVAELDAVALHIDKSTIRTGASFDNLQISSVTPLSYGSWVGGFGLPPASIGAPGADPNKDGVNNLLTAFFGGNPTGPRLPQLPQLDKLPNGNLCLVFQRNKALSDLKWLVERSTNGTDWTPAPPPVSVRDMG